MCNGRGGLKKRSPHVSPPSHNPSTVPLGVESSRASKSQIQVAGSLDGALVDQRFVGESACIGASFSGQALLDDVERLPNAIELALNLEPCGCGETLCGHLHLYTDQGDCCARAHARGTMLARLFSTGFGKSLRRRAEIQGVRSWQGSVQAISSKNRAAGSPQLRMDPPRGRTRAAPLN